MNEWWSQLTTLNQVFYAAAAFFSVFFVWQLLAMLIGLGGGEGEMDADAGDLDADAELGDDVTYEDFEHGASADAAETFAAFKLVSLRSVATFFTLFAWGGALYLDRGDSISLSLTYATLWGSGGMFAVALIFYWMRKLTETGTINLGTCVGTNGTVYLDIAEGGEGQVRVTVSGTISYVKARSADGGEIKSGVPIIVTRKLDQTTVEVKPTEREAE